MHLPGVITLNSITFGWQSDLWFVTSCLTCLGVLWPCDRRSMNFRATSAPVASSRASMTKPQAPRCNGRRIVYLVADSASRSWSCIKAMTSGELILL